MSADVASFTLGCTINVVGVYVLSADRVSSSTLLQSNDDDDDEDDQPLRC